MEPNPPPLPPMPPMAPPPPMARIPQYAPPLPPPAGRSPLFYIAIAGGCCGVPILLFIVLAAILFPVFAQAREKARQTSCLNNIKQLGMATIQYSQDWDEKYPAAKEWMTKLEPYTGVPAAGGGNATAGGDSGAGENSRRFRSVWQCPSVSSDRNVTDLFGYAYNVKVSGREQSSFSDKEIRMTPLIYDSEKLEKNASDPFQSVAYRHSHAACIGYADGHAQAVKSKTASGPE